RQGLHSAATGSARSAGRHPGHRVSVQGVVALRDIPLGETRSYGQVAARLGVPAAVRAVASACARNHLALLVPCHRVVGADGALTGYRWGVDRKRTLLEREGRPGGSARDATAQRSGAPTAAYDEAGRRR